MRVFPRLITNMMGFYAGEMGTGVQVDKIKRYGLEFFDARYRSQLGDARRWDLESGVLKQVEATLAETGESGLVAKLDAFWSSWQNLSVDPSNTALKGRPAAKRHQPGGCDQFAEYPAQSDPHRPEPEHHAECAGSQFDRRTGCPAERGDYAHVQH